MIRVDEPTARADALVSLSPEKSCVCLLSLLPPTFSQHEKVTASDVQEASNFMKDLGLDSLDTVEIQMMFEEEFAIEIPDDEADQIQTVASAIEFVATHPQAK